MTPLTKKDNEQPLFPIFLNMGIRQFNFIHLPIQGFKAKITQIDPLPCNPAVITK